MTILVGFCYHHVFLIATYLKICLDIYRYICMGLFVQVLSEAYDQRWISGAFLDKPMYI